MTNIRSMMRHLVFVALFFAAFCAYGQQKFALVIGNAAYTAVTPLRNTMNDAEDMNTTLINLGFSVELVRNGDLPSMINAVVRLGRNLQRSPDSYGFFYYSGHGVQSSNENYLIPVNADIQTEARLPYEALHLQYVLDELKNAENALNIVVLDACRNNPFSWAKSTSRGLTVVERQPPGSIIVYATSAGATASDGTGRNGTFTAELLNNLRAPGLEVKDMFNRTAAAVQRASGNSQIPAIYLQFFDAAYLGGATPQPAPTPVPSGWTPASEFELGLGEKGVTVKKYKGKATTVSIPAVIDGDPVIAIGQEAFLGCTELTSITIPTSVTAIGGSAFGVCRGLTSITVDAMNTRYSSTNGILFSKDGKILVCYPAGKTYTSYTIPTSVTAIETGAFVDCSRLTSVIIPISVTAIGRAAFLGCTGLTSITIPTSVTAIGMGAFTYCNGLTSITVDAMNTHYSSVDGILFSKDCKILVCYPAGKTTSSIPTSVTAIGDSAFSGCRLISITISTSVTYIGQLAFAYCSGLTSITIPTSVTTIGKRAFQGCSGLSAASREAIQRRFGDGVF